MPPKASNETAIEIAELKQQEVNFCLLGTSPIILNRMTEKAKRELLFPAPKKNRAELAANLKHDPIEEYRASVYRDHTNTGPTRLVFPSPAFKGALATAALEIPGATKSSIQRLCYVVGYSVPLFGIPQLHMSVVRMAGMNRTPDIRTRAIIPQWACPLKFRFVVPQLTVQSVTRLLSAAGTIVGVGDYRQEKGTGSFGQFELVSADDPRFLAIIKDGGREDQDRALQAPAAFDPETEELWGWFEGEVEARERKRK